MHRMLDWTQYLKVFFCVYPKTWKRRNAVEETQTAVVMDRRNTRRETGSDGTENGIWNNAFELDRMRDSSLRWSWGDGDDVPSKRRRDAWPMKSWRRSRMSMAFSFSLAGYPGLMKNIAFSFRLSLSLCIFVDLIFGMHLCIDFYN